MANCGAPTSRGRPCRRTADDTGRCTLHPREQTAEETPVDGVRAWVEVALAGVADDWRTALARRMADALDREPQAAKSAELRRLMGLILDGQLQSGPSKEGSTVDDLAARRAERRAAASAAD